MSARVPTAFGMARTALPTDSKQPPCVQQQRAPDLQPPVLLSAPAARQPTVVAAPVVANGDEKERAAAWHHGIIPAAASAVRWMYDHAAPMDGRGRRRGLFTGEHVHHEHHHHESSVLSGSEQQATDGSTGRPPVMYTSPVNMKNSSHCVVTRSYESAYTTTASGPDINATINTFLPFYAGNWNTAASTDGVFAAATLGSADGVAFSLAFSKSSVTGVTASTGPRMVRGGPTSSSYVTDPMTTGGGWTEWNNDFYQFMNIFRYSRLEKLELLVKMPNITRGVDPGSTGSTWSNLNGDLDIGELYISPWAGEPGVVTSYNTGDGALINSYTNGNLTRDAWDRMPGVVRVPLMDDRNQNPNRIIAITIKPTQPIVNIQSDATGQPILNGDETVVYSPMPVVDSYAFVNQEASHNAFGFKMFWSHPDLAGIVTATNNMVPWPSIGFRATMSWWGLLNPDAAAGVASPLLDLCLLPGAEERLRQFVAKQRALYQQQRLQLAQSVGELVAMQPKKAAVAPVVEEDYVCVKK